MVTYVTHIQRIRIQSRSIVVNYKLVVFNSPRIRTCYVCFTLHVAYVLHVINVIHVYTRKLYAFHTIRLLRLVLFDACMLTFWVRVVQERYRKHMSDVFQALTLLVYINT